MMNIFFLDDYNRVVLQTLPGQPDSDYINASYVDVSINQLNNIESPADPELQKCYILIYLTEYIKTKRLHRDSGTHRNDSNRILAYGLAGESIVHSYVN